MLNIQGLMKQAQMMQKKIEEAQEKLAQTEVSGTAANGLLSITLSGKREMKKISIDKSLVSPTVIFIVEEFLSEYQTTSSFSTSTSCSSNMS